MRKVKKFEAADLVGKFGIYFENKYFRSSFVDNIFVQELAESFNKDATDLMLLLANPEGDLIVEIDTKKHPGKTVFLTSKTQKSGVMDELIHKRRVKRKTADR